MSFESTLSAVYENHRVELERRGTDFNRHLDKQLGQINAQARMIKDLLRVIADCHCEKCNAALAKFSSYPLPTGRRS